MRIDEQIKEFLLLSSRVTKMEKEIKAYVKKHGNVNVDGKAYGEYPLVKNIRKVDAALLADCAINSGYSREEFYSAVSITLKNAKVIADAIGMAEEAYTTTEEVVQRGFGFVPEEEIL